MKHDSLRSPGWEHLEQSQEGRSYGDDGCGKNSTESRDAELIGSDGQVGQIVWLTKDSQVRLLNETTVRMFGDHLPFEVSSYIPWRLEEDRHSCNHDTVVISNDECEVFGRQFERGVFKGLLAAKDCVFFELANPEDE